MPHIARKITSRAQRVTLTVKTRLRTERSIPTELRRTIISINQLVEVVVPDVTAGRVDGLKGEARAIARTRDYYPATLLL